MSTRSRSLRVRASRPLASFTKPALLTQRRCSSDYAFKPHKHQVSSSCFDVPRTNDRNHRHLTWSPKSGLQADAGGSLKTLASHALQDQHVPSVDLISIRDSCTCDLCVDKQTGQRLFESAEIPQNLDVKDIVPDDDGNQAMISWVNDIDRYRSQSHSTHIKLSDVFNRTESAALREPFAQVPVTWKGSDIHGLQYENLLFTDFYNFLCDPESFERVMRQLCAYGIVFFKNVPEDERAVEQLGERIGPLRDTFYGRTWDVKDVPGSRNVAYTSHDLGLHQDLLYMNHPPGLQLLHCLKSSCEGGESIFADAFEAMHQLYYSQREAFDALASFPVSFHYRAPNKTYFDTKPVIELDRNIDAMRQAMQVHFLPPIRYVNWSPPFQAPFTIDVGSRNSKEFLRAYHRAAKAFQSLISNRESQFHHRLEPGECVVFNNRRILHGRAAFESGTGDRWLKGAYLDYDDYEAHLRHMFGKSDQSLTYAMS